MTVTTILLRRGSSDEWANKNPVLAVGEPGFDLDQNLLKIGDGFTAWSDLPGYLTGDALAGRFVRHDTAQNLSAADEQQALDNIGTGRILTPRQFGVTGGADDTATFQTAVDYLTSNGGGTLWCDEAQYKIGGLVLKTNVTLRSLSRRSKFVPADGFSDGWIFDTPPGPVKQQSIGLRDLVIDGGVRNNPGPDVGGIRFQNTFLAQVSNVAVSYTTLGCFQQLNGQATQLFGCGFLNNYNFRTLERDEGVLWLQGTDHIVISCECNGDDKDTVHYPGELYRAGMLLAGGTMWVYGSNGEYADVGIKITGPSNRLIGARGDVNAGPGIVVEGTNNALTNTLVLANSLAADGAYSHIQLGPGAYGTVLDGVTEDVNFTNTANQPGYVVDDQVDLVSNPTISEALPSIDNVVHHRGFKYRKVNQRNVSRAIQPPSAGNPIARPPSRYCAGQTFYDTKNGRVTISDGTFWRDLNAAIVGNLLPSRLALLDDPAGLGWIAYNAAGPSAVAGVSGWARFDRPRALEVTARGGSDSCAAQTAAPIPNVVAGKTYSLLAYHLGVTQLATLSVTIAWFDASGNQIGAAVPTPGDAQTQVGRPHKFTAAGLAAPDNATQVKLFPVFTRVGMQSGEKYQLTEVCLVPGGNPGDFVEP